MRYAIGLCLTIVAACSVVNAPDDPIEATADGGSGQGAAGPGGSGPGGGGQGGSVPGSCGDGVVDPGEDCDDGEESAACNADCTEASCGDGVLNVTANEQCDDANTTGDDACSATCEISVFVVDPEGPPDGFTGVMMQPSVTMASIDGEEHFVLAYVHFAGPEALEVRVAIYDARGNAVGDPLVLSTTAAAVAPSIAANSLGRLVVAWRDETPMSANATVRYAVLNPGVVPSSFVDVIVPESLGVRGFPRVASSPEDDGFCVQWLTPTDQVRVRCLDATGMVGGSATQTFGTAVPSGFSGALYGAHGLFAAGNGYISQFGNDGAITGQALTVIGQVQGPAFPITPAASGGDVVVENGYSPSGTSAFLSGFTLYGVFGGSPDNLFRAHFRRFTGPAQPAEPPTLLTNLATDEIGGWVVGQGNEAMYLYASLVGGIGSECILKAQRLSAMGDVVGPPIDLSEPGVEQCGVVAEAAVNAAGDVFIAWIQLDQSPGATIQATTRAALHPRLLPPL